MSISRVNVAVGDGGYNNANPYNSVSTAAQNHTNGNLLVALIKFSGLGNTVASVSDTAGNTWIPTGIRTTDWENCEIWYAKNIVGNASNIVSFTTTNADLFLTLIVIQYAGASKVDPFVAGATGSAGPSATTVTSASFSPLQGDVCVAMASQNSTASTNWTADAAYTLVANSGGGSNIEAEERLNAPAGSQTASMSIDTATGLDILVASFKPAGIITTPYLGHVRVVGSAPAGESDPFLGSVSVIGSAPAGEPDPYLGQVRTVVSAPAGETNPNLGTVVVVGSADAGVPDPYLGQVVEV